MAILDADGDEITYWPIPALAEGDETDPEVITIEDLPIAGALAVTNDSRVTVRGRISGIGSYVNLATTPIDLSGLGPGDVDVQIKVQANSPIVGLERVPIFTGVATTGPADWLAV